MRVAGAARVVPDHRRLDLLNRHLHLPPPRPSPSGRVRGKPADDLPRGTLLCGVVCRRDLRVERGSQRPRLRPVDDDLDEPQRVLVLADQPFRGDSLVAPVETLVVPGDPALVGVAVQHSPCLNCGNRTFPLARQSGYVAGRDPGALGEVVVIGPGVVGLDVGAGSGGRAAVELHPTVHGGLVTARHHSSKTPEMTLGPPRRVDRSTELRSMRAAGWGGVEAPVQDRISAFVMGCQGPPFGATNAVERVPAGVVGWGRGGIVSLKSSCRPGWSAAILGRHHSRRIHWTESTSQVLRLADL